jgi:hypothetical protein
MKIPYAAQCSVIALPTLLLTLSVNFDLLE